MKKIVSLLLVLIIIVSSLGACGSSGGENGVVRVYNSGDYIDESVIEMFEQETGIKVIYDTFETNEDMYLKIKNSPGYMYDVVVPSDYMIKKMIDEDMLAEINFDNVPNFEGIGRQYKGKEYDPEDKYSVAYQFGTVCIAYNKEKVTEPITSWNILFDEKYANQIFMMNSQRDTIGVALLSLGYSLNSTNPDELYEARDKLVAQKPLLITYTGDDIKDKMIGGEGLLGVVWSCDAGLILQESDNVGFAIPDEGTNIWFDSMCILKNAENKENAEKFINFMCREDIALLNAEYIGGSSPVLSVQDMLDPSISESDIFNPSEEDTEKYEVFYTLTEVEKIYEEIWTDVRF